VLVSHIPGRPVYGQDYALIYKEIPLVVNTGFLIDGDLLHPATRYKDPEYTAEN
jgi:hypothetical protein